MSGLLHVVLLDTGFDFNEVVFVGSQDECERYVTGELGPKLEAHGDEDVYYQLSAVVDLATALRHRTDELFDGDAPEGSTFPDESS